MPFYEYECSACKFYVETLQKMSDPPLKKCPSCKKPALKRLMSAPVFRLKGSGWYETDFKSEKEDKRNLVGEEKEPEKTEAKADSKADDKADTKPAADTKDTAKPESKSQDKQAQSKQRSPASKSSRAAKKAPGKPKAPAKKK
jgi:putative FmdB family regulatory protein